MKCRLIAFKNELEATEYKEWPFEEVNMMALEVCLLMMSIAGEK